ncbi:nucleotidyltransferase family protein [Micromonospora purpureochromogenes]|uniref:nucleotidyltransferase family protein n=1 Tax=Micromonospora purpureochromogenes TaxID=47872 RepID=UPI0033C0F716
MRAIADAVATWPEYATAVAVRLDASDQVVVCAPHGIDDLLDVVGGATRPGLAPRSAGNDSPTTAPPNAGPGFGSCP